MKVIGILYGLVCFGVCENSVSLSANWVDNLLNYIVEDSGARQIAFITRLSNGEKIKSPRINEIMVRLMQKLPSLRINIGEDRDKTEKSTPRDFNEIDTTATFNVIVHESRDTLPILPSEKLIDASAELSAFQYRPRYLILFETRVLTDGLEELLRYAWTKKILDLTIVELAEPVNHRIAAPIVHRLNPFKKEYTRVNWSMGVEWFPEKTDNMLGYPMKITVFNHPPFSIVQSNEFREPVNVRGAEIDVLRDMAKNLNASLKYVAKSILFDNIKNDADVASLHREAMVSQKIDVLSLLVSRSMTPKAWSLARTKMVVFDEFCAVVPILPKVTPIPIPANFFLACLFSFGIVIIFWIIRLVFGFEARRWQLFNIARALFGISVTRQPTTNVQRVIFGCLLVLSAIYSSTIYSYITNVSLLTNSEMEFKSFEDLDNSGLIPIIHSFNFNKTFDNAVGTLANLKKKTIQCSSLSAYDCALMAAKQKNITCLINRKVAEIAVARSRSKGRDTLKIAEPCFWFDSYSYPLNEGSPYRSSIDKVIGRLHSAGLIEKLYKDEKIVSRTQSHDADEEDWVLTRRENMIVLRQQLLAVAIIGYTLSILVFIGEIVVDRVSRYVKSKNKVSPIVKQDVQVPGQLLIE